MRFGDTYTSGRITVEGDLLRFLEMVYQAEEGTATKGRTPRHSFDTTCGMPNTRRGSRKNIHHHYDIGDEFYKLWLDEEMVYTCGYFPEQTAQFRRRATGQDGPRLPQIYGSPRRNGGRGRLRSAPLALHMARCYGVHVKAYNISHEQIRYAQARAEAEGLDARVQFIEDDYRTVSGRFDAFVSVGMLEHVGPSHYRELGRVIDRCLTPTGRGLIPVPWVATSPPKSTPGSNGGSSPARIRQAPGNARRPGALESLGAGHGESAACTMPKR